MKSSQKMYWCVIICCVLCCFGACIGLQCTYPQSKKIKFTIVSRRNQTGQWTAQLAHEAGPKDVGHWKADINHTTSICGDSESILIDASVTEPAPNVRALSLPGYELVPGLGYYKLHIVGKSWQEARKTCEEEGAHLLVIDSEYEAKNMARLWKEYPAFLARNTYYAFIGFHDLGNEGEVVTIFNKSLASTGYDNWDSTENDIRYNCGLFVQKNHKIEIGTCSIARGFFCEHEL
ncbi:hemolymph lipopolysaccharide-binding protein-like isoform X2 [Zootermopsis nevadensis]|uniref:hemolymph lipopolysaccharide-binding protein-like isoform X2 n=1 Tax=Zootermopsis nevadensis TaxID=136037 RepID=UPI000B8E335C|nr:hemolymph lipopolysaccharide-binding protein-like isoform X2 [Zootermopsis nevadensis]